MDQEQLSGEIGTNQPGIREEYPLQDFGDIDLGQIEDYDPTVTHNPDEELSDYGEDSIKPPSSLYAPKNGKKKSPAAPKAKAKANGQNGKVTRQNGKKGIGKKAVSDDQDDMSDGSFQPQSNYEGGYNDDDDRSLFNGYVTDQKAPTTTNNNNHSKASKPKPLDEDELSDYDDNNEEDIEISQYHNSLFGDLHSQRGDGNSSVLPNSRKLNSSNNFDGMSEDVKQSQRTNDMLFNPYSKKQMAAKLKGEKKQKFNQNSIELMGEERSAAAIKKFEKMENKKRFSKKQLELVSRKFADYYAYETNPDCKGNKIKLRDIGQMFDLGHATVHKLYAEWMDDPYFYERIKRYDRYRKQTKNPERKLTLDRLEHITRLIKENPFLTQYELCVQLNKVDELKVVKCGKVQNMTRTIVGKLLRMGKFRKKRVKCIPKEKNTSKSLEKRYDYCLKYQEILERRAKVYFLDESGFNLYMTRDKAWSRPNEEITVNCPISKGKRFSLIAIIGDDGLAHWRFIEGNYRKFEYLDFIRELFQKINENKSPDDPEEKWIVMDNCAIHDKEQTINLAKQYGINILYLPSYSPQLNPIENWFHEIKCKLKKINYSGQKQLFKIMEQLLGQYQDHDFSNYYHGSLKFVEKGLKKQKF